MKFQQDYLEFITFEETDNSKKFIEELYDDDTSKKYLPKIRTLEANKNDRIYQKHFIVKDLNTNDLIGFVYFHKPFLDEVELVYGIHPDYRGRGYGTKLLIKSSELILKKDKDINYIRLVISHYNYASQTVAFKSGFERDGGIAYYKKR